jgi:hypothetical protein
MNYPVGLVRIGCAPGEKPNLPNASPELSPYETMPADPSHVHMNMVHVRVKQKWQA